MNLNQSRTETLDVTIDSFTFTVRLYSDAVGSAHEIESVHDDFTGVDVDLAHALGVVGLSESDVIDEAIEVAAAC
jgi:hypothetical protein